MTELSVSQGTGRVSKAVDTMLVVSYVALMAINFLGELAGLPRMLKLASVVVVGIAILKFIILFDVDHARYSLDYLAIISIPVIIVLSVSVVIWLVNLEPFGKMLAASERLLVQVINIFAAVAAIYLFRGAAMRYTLYGMSIAYGYIIFRAFRRFGAAEFLSSLLRFIRTAGISTTGAMAALEVHDMTFAFGFFAVYYCTAKKDEPKRRLCQILSLVCFILGYKRIAIFGLVIAIAYNVYFSKIRDSEKGSALMRLSTFLFVFCYGYIAMTRSGLFTALMAKFGINMMGRDGLYRFINQYYDLSITFPGYGFNWVRDFLVSLREAGDSEFGAGAIHNDIVRQYIELGFWGYLLWSGFELRIRPKWMLEKHGVDSLRVYMLCTIYIFFTYLTDNTMYYYHTAFAYRIVPLICAQMYHDRADDRIIANTKGSSNEKRSKGGDGKKAARSSREA